MAFVGRNGYLLATVIMASTCWSLPRHHAPTSWQPAKLVAGSPVLFRVPASAGVREVFGDWFGHKLVFFKAQGDAWYALAGVPIETEPGTYDLKIFQQPAGPKALELTQRVRIERARYPVIQVKVGKQFTEPNPGQLREAQEDKRLKEQVFSAITPARSWSGAFFAPVPVPVSDIFGTARVFNGEVKSRHQGLDFAAPAGTEVRAINQGTVVLARNLFFEGNCVVIDHGQGLLSLYLHLSEFRIAEGEKVKSGQIIALSGGSGRASGPHLHLAVRWQGVYVDPAILLKIKVPPEEPH